MSLASGLMCGGGRFTCLGEVPTGATVREVQERAAYAARMAEHYRRLQNTAAARVWSNAAERLRKELLARASSLGGLPARGSIPMKQVERVMKKLQPKVERCGVSKTALREGMAVEREHRDVTKLGVEKTARIALAHLCERKDYYKRLKKYVER